MIRAASKRSASGVRSRCRCFALEKAHGWLVSGLIARRTEQGPMKGAIKGSGCFFPTNQGAGVTSALSSQLSHTSHQPHNRPLRGSGKNGNFVRGRLVGIATRACILRSAMTSADRRLESGFGSTPSCISKTLNRMVHASPAGKTKP